MMGCVEEKVKAGGLSSGARTSLLEEMKFLKEMQDQSGLFFFVKIYFMSSLRIWLWLWLGNFRFEFFGAECSYRRNLEHI